ncbi:UNVERIFIED_CONTAM: hypothetical protein K2H54_036767 [Gekko kuhli]
MVDRAARAAAAAAVCNLPRRRVSAPLQPRPLPARWEDADLGGGGGGEAGERFLGQSPPAIAAGLQRRA